MGTASCSNCLEPPFFTFPISLRRYERCASLQPSHPFLTTDENDLRTSWHNGTGLPQFRSTCLLLKDVSIDSFYRNWRVSYFRQDPLGPGSSYGMELRTYEHVCTAAGQHWVQLPLYVHAVAAHMTYGSNG